MTATKTATPTPTAEPDLTAARRGDVFWPVLLLATTAATVAASVGRPLHPDFHIARSAGRELLSGSALSTYADHPEAQMGPLALVVAQLPRPGYVVAVAVAAGVMVCLLAAAAGWPRSAGARLTAVLGAGLIAGAWPALAWKGHADDAIVLLGCGWLLVGLAAQRPRREHVAAVTLALLGKPTAVVLLALLGEPAAIIAAVIAATVVYGPFVLAHAGAMTSAGKGIMPVAHGSLPDLVGYRPGHRIPGWLRPAQLGLGLAGTLWGRLRHRPDLGLLLAFTLRALLETNPAPAYSIPLVVLALLPDLQRGYPLLLPLAAMSLWLSPPVLHGSSGWPRLISLVTLAAAIVCSSFARSPAHQVDIT